MGPPSASIGVSIPLRKFRKLLEELKEKKEAPVSIPLRKFRKHLSLPTRGRSPSVSIPLRKFRKKVVVPTSYGRSWSFHPSKEV